MTDDDRFDGIDSVHADHVSTCCHPELTGVRTRALPEASPKPARDSRVGRTQDHEHAPAAPEGIDSRSPCGRAIAADDEIDGSDHCVDLVAGPPTTRDPLSVRKNASSCRNSTGFSRRFRNSLWPVAAAGARL